MTDDNTERVWVREGNFGPIVCWEQNGILLDSWGPGLEQMPSRALALAMLRELQAHEV